MNSGSWDSVADLNALRSYCIENDRVCPQPMRWHELWELLPDRRRVGVGWEPPLPLVLGAWWNSTDEDKRARLAEHIRWAEAHRALEGADKSLRGLSETDWHHKGE
jgi:hypothetical protein